jgi:hypothetical protein
MPAKFNVIDEQETRERRRALSVMPLEWTDLCMIGKLLPAQQSGPLSVILEQLERSGEIEVRQAANPQRVQVRKRANKEASDGR